MLGSEIAKDRFTGKGMKYFDSQKNSADDVVVTFATEPLIDEYGTRVREKRRFKNSNISMRTAI